MATDIAVVKKLEPCPFCEGDATAAPADVPADVAELVIAARIVAFEDQSPEALKRLDKASEAFASRVEWDDEPDAGGAL